MDVGPLVLRLSFFAARLMKHTAFLTHRGEKCPRFRRLGVRDDRLVGPLGFSWRVRFPGQEFAMKVAAAALSRQIEWPMHVAWPTRGDLPSRGDLISVRFAAS